MALLEELNGATEGSAGDAESLKAEHRRKRAKGANSKARKKKRAGVRNNHNSLQQHDTVPELESLVMKGHCWLEGSCFWPRLGALLRI